MDALYLGAVLPAAVKGVEDHGYSLTFGVKVRCLCPEWQVISIAALHVAEGFASFPIVGSHDSRPGTGRGVTGQARYKFSM